MNTMKIILVGMGHEMHGDDEIGLEVVRRWSAENQGKYRGMKIQTSLLESPGVNLLGLIAGLDAAILVAAIRSGAPLGTVLVLDKEELTISPGAEISWGGGGAAETLSLGRQLAPDDLPDKLVLLGIEGAAFGLGEGLSPAVRASIPQALQALNQVLNEYTGFGDRLRRTFKQLMGRLKGKTGSS